MSIRTSFFIGGRWVESAARETTQLVSASTEEPLGMAPVASTADIDLAVTAARSAFDDAQGWAHWSPHRRASVLEQMADAIDERCDEIARLVSSQNGMPITLSTAQEAPSAGRLLRYYAGLAREFAIEREHPHASGGTTTERQEPMGVVAAIAPWNFPQSLAAFKYAPALAAGCTVVLKPSPETLLDSYALAEAVMTTDLPPGVLNVVGGGREMGAYLVAHAGVDKVAFTGSTSAGTLVAETCGRLLRPVTLELGGKSAAIVLDDAVLDEAATGAALFGSTLLNNGQTCFLSTRILAPDSRYDEVVDVFAELVSTLRVGDALDPTTTIGPMASRAQQRRVEGYIARGRHDGARCVVGGSTSERTRGWFVEPTLFADVDNASPIAQEEIFGPVLSVIRYTDTDDAVRLANQSRYGLAGTVWTSDLDRGMEVARRIRTGTVGINGYRPDIGAPFGGVKHSGIGRELGPGSLAAYTQTKSVYA